MGLGPIFNLSAWDSVARQAMIRCGTCLYINQPAPPYPCKMLWKC